MFDVLDENGVPVHMYGPYIFHTNSLRVYEHITKFGEFESYEHRVLGFIDGKFVPIPFNFKSMEELRCRRRPMGLGSSFCKSLKGAAGVGDGAAWQR